MSIEIFRTLRNWRTQQRPLFLMKKMSVVLKIDDSVLRLEIILMLFSRKNSKRNHCHESIVRNETILRLRHETLVLFSQNAHFDKNSNIDKKAFDTNFKPQ